MFALASRAVMTFRPNISFQTELHRQKVAGWLGQRENQVVQRCFKRLNSSPLVSVVSGAEAPAAHSKRLSTDMNVEVPGNYRFRNISPNIFESEFL
jgi:hypothetical protein